MMYMKRAAINFIFYHAKWKGQNDFVVHYSTYSNCLNLTNKSNSFFVNHYGINKCPTQKFSSCTILLCNKLLESSTSTSKFNTGSSSERVSLQSHSVQNLAAANKEPTSQDAKPADTTAAPISAAARLKDAVIRKVLPRSKEMQSFVSTERNFITAVRAMSEFLLTPSDLAELRKTKRRSPFENEPRITVYWMKDVENKAMEVWKSKEALEKERNRREKELQRHKRNLFNLRRLLMEMQPQPSIPPPPDEFPGTPTSTASSGAGGSTSDGSKPKSEHKGLDASGKVVYTAVAINAVNFLLKFGAWLYTGSACLFAEALHSLADTSNQLILAYGIHKSIQRADSEHPYGYSNMPYVSSLISGAMIFCLGAGVSVHHGIAGLITPPEVVPLYWAFYILGGSMLTEGGTLLMAIHTIRKGAQLQKKTFMEYVSMGDKELRMQINGEDPSVTVVLLEDTAAVLGVGVALTCLGLTSVLGSTTPDALGSCIIGGLLGSVAAFIIRSNVGPLVGRSIPRHELAHMNRIMEEDVMVRALHDVKGIDMGTGLVRYKAEVDFDGRELTRAYLAKQDLNVILEEMNNLKTADDVNTFLLNFGENVVDTLGAEIDRIEQSLKRAHPEVRHCDLEIL